MHSGGQQQRGMRRRPRRFRDTLILLDQPTADGMPGAPIGTATPPHRERRPRRFPDRREVAIAAAVLVAIVVAGGSVVLQSRASAPQGGAAPNVAVVPSFAQYGSGHTASPAPARTSRAHHTSRPPAPTVQVTSSATQGPPPPALVVTYRLDSQGDGGFQAEVDVTNNGSQPISGWQIVVALPEDTFQSWWNATGYVSNHILLLYQPASSGPIPADGGTLRVYFVASGPQTTPVVCGFNGTSCGGL